MKIETTSGKDMVAAVNASEFGSYLQHSSVTPFAAKCDGVSFVEVLVARLESLSHAADAFGNGRSMNPRL